MKRLLVFCLLAFVPLLGGARFASAEGGIETEVAVKSWINSWESKDPALGTFKSDVAVLLGPVITIRSTNVLLEASFFISTSDYKFSDGFTAAQYERQDLDALIGYRILEEVAVVGGYRLTELREKQTGDEVTLYGPAVGFRGTLPLTERVSLYGNFTYLFTRFKQDNIMGTITEDSPGWTAELGFGYAFSKQFSAAVGYKYETNTGKESEVTDSFAGFTLAVAVLF